MATEWLVYAPAKGIIVRYDFAGALDSVFISISISLAGIRASLRKTGP